MMTVLGCSLGLAGSQIAPLLYLTVGTSIAIDLGAPDLTLWMLTAILVAIGAMAPFVGPLADLFGRKMIFIIGLTLSIVGSIVCAATPNAPGFIAGQLLLGFGSVSQELLAIAIIAEIVPTAKRPLYGALSLCAIIPWSPSTLYANLMAISSWRWIGCTLAIWNTLTVLCIAFYYHPPPRVNSLGLTKRQMVGRVDFLGGFLLTAGLLLFLVGINTGGVNFPWKSARVLCCLIIGVALVVGFVFWEMFGAKYPLFPRRMVHAPRPFFCMLMVIFAAGINYMPVVVFWPIESISVFGSDHRQTGINCVPIGICILGGAITSAILIGVFKRHVMVVMTAFCVMQTVGEY
jgi:MFS family permease